MHNLSSVIFLNGDIEVKMEANKERQCFIEKVRISRKQVNEMEIYSFVENMCFFDKFLQEYETKDRDIKEENKKEIIVIDGPIASGKSTIGHNYIRINSIRNLEYMNPDFFVYRKILEYGFSTAYQISRDEMWERVNWKIINNESFMIEMVIAKMDKIEFLNLCRSKGYTIKGIYVGTDSVITIKQRAKKRMEEGGYLVPESKIDSRYLMSRSRFHIFFDLADEMLVVDNSKDKPRLIAYKHKEFLWEDQDSPKWYKNILKRKDNILINF